MVYETFLKTIQSMVQTRLNKKANVSLRRVLKNNGLMLALRNPAHGYHRLSI